MERINGTQVPTVSRELDELKEKYINDLIVLADKYFIPRRILISAGINGLLNEQER